MTKKELIRFLEPFKDDIEVVVSSKSLTGPTMLPAKIKYVILDDEGTILIDIIS